jgi:hypothetical protein
VRRLTVLAATLLVLGLVGGCGGGDEDGGKPGSGGDKAGADAAATPAIPSGVEGVPVPRDAHRSLETKGAWEVLGMTFDEVVDWYDLRLPEGKDFKGWTWCDTDGDAENPSRIYSQGSRILTVTINDDTPPGVLIGVDKSGPC